MLNKLTEAKQNLYEMANLSNEDTGISSKNIVLYASLTQGSHSIRVKVYRLPNVGKNKPNVAFSVEREPKILKINGLHLTPKEIREIKYFISINTVPLYDLWKGKYLSSRDFKDDLEKI